MQATRPEREYHEADDRTRSVQHMVDRHPAEAGRGTGQHGKGIRQERAPVRETVPYKMSGGAEHDGQARARDERRDQRIRVREPRVPAVG